MIAIDWGTTTFRAYLVADDGSVRDRRVSTEGLLSIREGQFGRSLEQHIGDWYAAGAGPVLMSGMVGSRQGWVEVPYVGCPAGADEIAAGLTRVSWGDGRDAWIAPAVSCVDSAGVPDVMRGEEVQVLGGLAELDPAPTWFCLPGTHSKWVRVDNGRIVEFTTHMTGEWFALARAHSLLGRMMTDGPLDADAFDAGIRRAAAPGGMLHHVFGVRALGLFGDLTAAAAPWYLSGILIGHELQALPPIDGPVALAGSTTLMPLYVRALAHAGIQAIPLPDDIVVRGLLQLVPFVEAQAC